MTIKYNFYFTWNWNWYCVNFTENGSS